MALIIQTGSYLPGEPISNDQLIDKYDLSSDNEWIVQRTGIKSRYFASDQLETSQLAIGAVENLMSKLDWDIRAQINFVIVASMSSQLVTPSIASHIIATCGLTKAWGFDLSGACSGFVLALDIADKYGSSLNEGYTLVIGAETMSQILDFSDRSSCILFGDGAAALLIQNDGSGLVNYRSQIFNHDQNFDAIKLDHSTDHFLKMEGRQVFNFVNRQVIPSVKSFFNEKLDTLDYLICHQANQRLLDLFQSKLNLGPEKVVSNISQVANTSAASIPLLIDHLVSSNQLQLKGTQAIGLCGFGAGLTWASAYLTL